MRSNYKPIGNYIRQVKTRNTALISTSPMGIKINKEFMPSVANTLGTDLTNYRVVSKNQFAYNPMHVGRDEVVPIALLKTDEKIIVSPAYVVFEIIDHELLDPEYLKMWCRRSEFDRNAWFTTDSSVRGGFSWGTLCEMELSVPDITTQQEVVKEYNIIVDRIKLNEELNQKLEETAQTLYKHWFVNFEFPDENGKPYKSSGGEMVYNEEFNRKIPIEWEENNLSNYVRLSQGQVINAKTDHLIVEKGLPLLRITDLVNDTQKIFIDESVNQNNIATKDDIIYSRTGQVGLVFRNKEGVVYNNCFKVIPINNTMSKEYLYWYLKDSRIRNLMIELASSSAQPDLTHSAFLSVNIILPITKIQERFSKKIISIEKLLYFMESQNKILHKMEHIILSKMSNVKSSRIEQMV